MNNFISNFKHSPRLYLSDYPRSLRSAFKKLHFTNSTATTMKGRKTTLLISPVILLCLCMKVLYANSIGYNNIEIIM